MAANVQGKGRRQREREDEKRIKREEREKKRTLNEELKMKRMQERSDKQKKKDEEKQHKVQACPKKHKRKSTNATAQFTKRTKERTRRGNWSGTPGKSGLEWSRCHDKVHVSCVGKAYLQYVEGYVDSDDDDFEFLCTRCFRFDDNSSIDTCGSESDYII